MPLSVLAGRADVMAHARDDVFFYTTFGGEALSLAAAKATMAQLQRHDVPGHLERLGRRLQKGLEALAGELGFEGLRCTGLPCRTLLSCDLPGADPLLVKSFVQQELIGCGVLWGGFHALSYSHDEQDIDYLLSAYRAVLPALARAVEGGTLREQLRGRPIQPGLRALPPRRLAARETAGGGAAQVNAERGS
jgi:glutamate-1-semialdehyde aminotransferase